MRFAAVAALVLLAGAAGYLVGRGQAGPGGRADADRDALERQDRRRIELRPEEYAAIMERAAREEALAEENRRLRERLAVRAPEEEGAGTAEGPVPGMRREDGTIVGGARWSKMTTNMALGFLDGMVASFFREANLTEMQQERLRAEMEKRVGEVMQTAADFVNADVTADEAYAALDTIANESRKVLATVLDEKQMGIYRRFERGMVDFVHTNVVNNEMTTLRRELDLDQEQEKNVRRLVEERFRRVQDRLNAPIPNMFFKPMRRETDRDIYAETGAQIALYLRPEQAGAFTAVEEKAATALYEYRSLLIPRAP